MPCKKEIENYNINIFLFKKYIKQELKKSNQQNYIDLNDLQKIIYKEYIGDINLKIFISLDVRLRYMRSGFDIGNYAPQLPDSACILIDKFYHPRLESTLLSRQKLEEDFIKTEAFYIAKIVKTVVPPLPAIDKLLLPVVA